MVEEAPTASSTKSAPISNNLRSTKSLFAPKEKNVKEIDHNQPKDENPFNEADLKVYWNKIAEKFQKNHDINKYVLMNREWNLEENTIHLSLESEVQKNQFNESIRYDLLENIRNHFKNHLIDIQIEVEKFEENSSNNLYTQSDKMDYLIEQYPVLSEFKKKFGLDPDY